MIDPFDLDNAMIGEPLSVSLDKSHQWQRTVDIDATLFDLKYMLRDKAPASVKTQEFNMVNVAGSTWAVDVEPTDMLTWVSGDFFWDLVIVRKADSREKTIDVGEIKIFAVDTDRRSHAQIMVVKIESILQSRADSDVESYSVKSRSITKMSASELRDWREYYIREMNNQVEDVNIFTPAKLNDNSIRVRFTN